MQRHSVDIGPELERELNEWLARHPEETRTLDELVNDLLEAWLEETSQDTA